MSRMLTNNEPIEAVLAINYNATAPIVNSDKIDALWTWLLTSFLEMETELQTLVDRMELLEQDIQEMRTELRNM